MAAVSPSKAGTAAGLSSSMRYLGGIVTIAVQAALLAGGAGVTVEEHVALAKLYVAAAGAAVAAAVLLPRNPVRMHD